MMRIAAIQCRPIPDDADAAISAIVDRLRWADREAIDLLVFPEAFLLGHSYDPEIIRARAIAASASAIPRLCDRVAGFRTSLVVGSFEQVEGRIFNSAFVIEQGRIVGRYAKAHPNEPGVTAGSAFPIFTRSQFRYGLNICNDANHPDAAARIAEQGAGLIVYPLNNMLAPDIAERWREKSLANLVARARQTGCWIMSADVAGPLDDRISFGCTAIVDPDGEVVARVPEMAEGAIAYDL